MNEGAGSGVNPTVWAVMEHEPTCIRKKITNIYQTKIKLPKHNVLTLLVPNALQKHMGRVGKQSVPKKKQNIIYKLN